MGIQRSGANPRAVQLTAILPVALLPAARDVTLLARVVAGHSAAYTLPMRVGAIARQVCCPQSSRADHTESRCIWEGWEWGGRRQRRTRCNMVYRQYSGCPATLGRVWPRARWP